MSLTPLSSTSPMSGVSPEAYSQMPVEMKWFFVQAERAGSLETLMNAKIDEFKGRTDRIRKLNELKGALQDLEALCSGKKPEDDISGVLSANPQLKARIDQLSAETGVEPFSSSQSASSAGASTAVNSAYLDSLDEPPPFTPPEELNQDEILAILKNSDLRDDVMSQLVMDQQGLLQGHFNIHRVKEGNAILAKGDPYRDKMLEYLKSDEAKALVAYLEANKAGGLEKIKAQLQSQGSGTEAVPSATNGPIQFGQIKSAFTRIDGQINAVSSEQQIDTMQLNSINQQRSACFESMAAALRTWKEVTNTIFR